MTGNRTGPEGWPHLKESASNKRRFFDDFGPFPACPRACARGALVARTGRLVGGHLGRFPSWHAAVAQW